MLTSRSLSSLLSVGRYLCWVTGGSRVDRGPCWPPLSVCIRRLIAIIRLANSLPLYKRTYQTFRRYSSADFNVRFLNDKTAIDLLASSTTILGCQHPLLVGFCQAFNWNDADTSLIIAAVTRSKPYTPTGLATK